MIDSEADLSLINNYLMGQVLWEIWGYNDNIQMTLNFLYYPNSDAQVTPVTTKSPSKLGGGGYSLFFEN